MLRPTCWIASLAIIALGMPSDAEPIRIVGRPIDVDQVVDHQHDVAQLVVLHSPWEQPLAIADPYELPAGFSGLALLKQDAAASGGILEDPTFWTSALTQGSASRHPKAGVAFRWSSVFAVAGW